MGGVNVDGREVGLKCVSSLCLLVVEHPGEGGRGDEVKE